MNSASVVRAAFLVLATLVSGGVAGCAGDDDGNEEIETVDPIGSEDDGGSDEGESDGGTADPGDPGKPAVNDPGQGDGKDVVTIGDSWMSLGASLGIQNSLEKVSGQDYRTHGVGGTRLLNEQIVNQYKTAKKDGPIKTVIMTAGGNDILMDGAVLLTCDDPDFDKAPTCSNRIDEVGARLVKLWAEMAADGVKDVVYVSYSRKANIVGPLVKCAEYTLKALSPLCAAVPAPLRCHLIDADTLMKAGALASDGIHPNAVFYDELGAGVYDLMKEEDMAR